MKKLSLLLGWLLLWGMVGAQDNFAEVGKKIDKTLKQAGQVTENAKALTKDVKKLVGKDSVLSKKDSASLKADEQKADSILKKTAGLATDSNAVTLSGVYKDFKAAIIAMAQTMKVGVEGLWMVLVKQQIVKAIMIIATILLLLIFFILLIVFTKIMYKKSQEHKETDAWTIFDGGTIFGIVCTFICGVALVWYSLANMYTAATGFINPEYGAIKDIVEMVQTKNVK